MPKLLRSSAVAFIVSTLSVLSARAACPAVAPGAMTLSTSPSACTSNSACPNGPVTLVLAPYPALTLPPFAPEGYTISPCDTVTWDFDDGTSQSLLGSDRVTHDYPMPGNYIIRATVTNALGSTTVTYGDSNGALIASSPSRLSFLTGDGGSGVACANCVVAREGSGAVTITVRRTLDLSRSISADAFVTEYATSKSVQTHLVFAPNETEKSFSIPVKDDQVYSGIYDGYFPLGFGNPTGGTLTVMNTPWQPALYIAEDEPRPTLSFERNVVLPEGDSGSTLVSIPVHLSAPMGFPWSAEAFPEPCCAPPSYVTSIGGFGIKPGDTSGFVTAVIRGNTLPEPDKSFQIRMRVFVSDGPPFDGTILTVTILNDDAALYPVQTGVVATGTPVALVLDIGSPYPGPTTATFTSSSPDVVPAPAPVTIPAGATKIDVLVTPRTEGRAQISPVLPGRTTQPATITATTPRRRATR